MYSRFLRCLVLYVLSCPTCLVLHVLWCLTCPLCVVFYVLISTLCVRAPCASCPVCSRASRVLCLACPRALRTNCHTWSRALYTSCLRCLVFYILSCFMSTFPLRNPKCLVPCILTFCSLEFPCFILLFLFFCSFITFLGEFAKVKTNLTCQ